MNTPKPSLTPPLSTKPRRRFWAWLQRHHVALTLVCASAVIAGIFIVAVTSLRFSDTPLTFLPKKKPAEKFYSQLTGLEVADAAALKQPVTAVMIENSPDARPQSGLKAAGVVYEAVAEGGITRFMALYQGDKPQLIGPVRSLRLYYLQWATPYQASIAHVGGSGNALSEVRSGRYRDIDQFFNAGSYWRARDRYAPHNMYTSGAKLDELNRAKGYTESVFAGPPRTDGKPAETPNATNITVSFSSPLYSTAYTYDKASNSYLRSLAGAAHADREAGRLAPNVVAVIEVSAHGRGDGYEDLRTTGSGKAHLFQNGTVIAATWKKASPTSALEFVDSDQKPIPLQRGQLWVAAITPGRGSVSWQ